MKYSHQEPKVLPHITIIGAGVRGRKQLTLESIKIIRESSYVLYFPIEDKLHDWLTNSIGVKNAESLSDLYKNGAQDLENYKRIVSKIIEVSSKFKDVAVLVPGHPYIGVSWIKSLNKMAMENLIHLNVIEGISSFDTMISDLKIDPLDHGATIIDANRLLLFQLKIEPKIDLYIYHICSVGNSRTDYEDLSKNNHLEKLQKYLIQFYPLNHNVVLIGCNSNSNKSLIKSCKLNELNNLHSYISVATSLFVPGLGFTKDDIDKEFYNLVQSTV
ncbi:MULTISPECIES: SAM-dependent methyltransferase [Heyndrickxia]|uniref:SAM-dependent methyltransferase n=1 Tax=Heyndrickxia TaxID=2837504 RepID=UPI002E24749A|nr:SAM-dependent methyltransferase [Heyndrickxia coagulans]MED4935970.1 SAM-dependent methyltransferase [Heyndrickxia coagulans]